MILVFCLIHPCDGQTDRRTDRRTELRWLRRAIVVPAVARKNEELKNKNQKNKNDKTKADYSVVTSRRCHMIGEIKMFSVCAEKSTDMLQ